MFLFSPFLNFLFFFLTRTHWNAAGWAKASRKKKTDIFPYVVCFLYSWPDVHTRRNASTWRLLTSSRAWVSKEEKLSRARDCRTTLPHYLPLLLRSRKKKRMYPGDGTTLERLEFNWAAMLFGIKTPLAIIDKADCEISNFCLNCYYYFNIWFDFEKKT